MMQASQLFTPSTLRFVRYAATGVLNTAVTVGLYYALRYVDVQIDLANGLSYAAGMLNSFVWNKLWVFRSRGGGWWREAVLFFAGTGLCWLLQWVAFRAMLAVSTETVSYLTGMVVYPVANYFYNRLVTFRRSM